ncbi:unnamed protein product [Phaedon cochleariae]|uniref:Uncharacterized protein n=1 Tax=Phaedon cochleariae TaxID=80249 RepID=A0A9N9SIF8_PHACE|nr:unnamed protein product [Phaedon cochleariae]
MFEFSSDSSLDGTQNRYSKCLEFLNVTLFAENFVDSVIEEATNTIQSEWTYEAQRVSNVSASVDRESVYTYNYIDPAKPEFTTWPTIGNFTIELGAKKINEYLSSFPVDEEWLYAIYYLSTIYEDVSDLHEYEAKWSLPTASYPIAQSTASVFFTIEVSRILPKDCLVKASTPVS